jgi:hypothetical protein
VGVLELFILSAPEAAIKGTVAALTSSAVKKTIAF